MIKFYEEAKKRGDKKNMTDLYYMNHAAAAVNYSYALRLKKQYKEEVKYLKVGQKYFKLFMKLAKKGKQYEQAKEQLKILDTELLPPAIEKAGMKPTSK